MIDMIMKWLYQNSVAIIISSLISLLISMMYYRKGNRDELLMSVKFTPTQPDVMKIVEKLTEK